MHFPEIEQKFPELWQRLCRARARNMTGQAYLLIGDDAPLTESFAMAWAQTAACTDPLPDGAPCGECQACRLFIQKAYPDLYIVRPQSKSRIITVDDMRDFDHNLSLTARPGFLKIGILAEADRLNDASQNAFLKTLEEPPAHTMLLLLTANAKMLLPTTKSRCQILSLLQNRAKYENAAAHGLFPLLSLLQPLAGAAPAIQAASGIAAIFDELHGDAEQFVGELDLSTLEGTENPALRKQLEEEHTSRIEAEYIRLRNEITGAMQDWFLQQLLISKGASRELLPCPEMLEGLALPSIAPDKAEEALQHIGDFLRSLALNVEERLALDDLCLQITSK